MLIIPKISRLSRSTNGSNKKHPEKRQLGANNLCYVLRPFPPHLFRSRFLLPSLSISTVQLLFIPHPSDSSTRPFPNQLLVRQSSLTKRGREGIWNWGKPLMRRSCKSPVKVTELLSQWITVGSRASGLEAIIGDLGRSNHSPSRAILFSSKCTCMCRQIDR